MDSIPLGRDFRRVIHDAVVRCDVLLVVIGPGWLTAAKMPGRRRLDDPEDFVRMEIEAAIERDIPIIPLLVNNATMPTAEDLPPSLHTLAYRNGLLIRPDPDFHNDMGRLIAALSKTRSPLPRRQVSTLLLVSVVMAALVLLLAILAMTFRWIGPPRDDVVRTPSGTITTEEVTKPEASKATAPSTAATATPTPATPSALVRAEGWGTLKGQVILSGNPPAPKVLRAKGKAEMDPAFCAKYAPIPNERLIVDDATKGVKNVLVYIPKPTAVNEEARSKAATAKLEFDQQDCTFKPHVLAVETGTAVTLRNSDPVNHNINSRLKNNWFNKLLSGNQRQEQPVNAPERTPGELTCDIHPWMKAYWMVLDNPYFAVTDEKGNFEIKDVPAGTQKVVVWQEAVAPNGFVTAPTGEGVEIKANDTTTKSFTIEAGKLRPE